MPSTLTPLRLHQVLGIATMPCPTSTPPHEYSNPSERTRPPNIGTQISGTKSGALHGYCPTDQTRPLLSFLSPIPVHSLSLSFFLVLLFLLLSFLEKILGGEMLAIFPTQYSSYPLPFYFSPVFPPQVPLPPFTSFYFLLPESFALL